MSRIAFAIFLSIFALPLFAATPDAATSVAANTAVAAGSGVGAELVRVLLSLAGVVALILGAGWLTRRLQAISRPSGRRMKCVESMSVGVKERVLLLEVGGTQLVVGIAPGCVRTLHVLDAPLAEPLATDTSSAPRGFAHVLSQLRSGGAK